MPSTALLGGSPLDGDFATQKAGSKEEEEPSSPSPSCSSTPILLCPSTDPSTVLGAPTIKTLYPFHMHRTVLSCCYSNSDWAVSFTYLFAQFSHLLCLFFFAVVCLPTKSPPPR